MSETQENLVFDFNRIFKDIYDLRNIENLPDHDIPHNIVEHSCRRMTDFPSLREKGITSYWADSWCVEYRDSSVELKQQQMIFLNVYAIIHQVSRNRIYVAEELLKSDFYNEWGLILSSENQRKLVKLENIFLSIQNVLSNNRNAYHYYVRDEPYLLTDGQLKLFKDIDDLFYKSFVTLANVLMDVKTFEDKQDIEKFSKIISDDIVSFNEI